MIMDGNCDYMVAFLLVINFKNVDLVWLSITPSDCKVPPTKEFRTKI